jgi:type IV secretory pathway VirB10-like protein
MPNGRSINIGSMTGADLTGASGLEDRTDGHFWQLAKGIVLSTLFSVGAASAQDAGARSSGGLVDQQCHQRRFQRGPAGRPEDHRARPEPPADDQVRAGWPLRVIVNKDMILAPYQ